MAQGPAGSVLPPLQLLIALLSGPWERSGSHPTPETSVPAPQPSHLTGNVVCSQQGLIHRLHEGSKPCCPRPQASIPARQAAPGGPSPNDAGKGNLSFVFFALEIWFGLIRK